MYIQSLVVQGLENRKTRRYSTMRHRFYSGVYIGLNSTRLHILSPISFLQGHRRNTSVKKYDNATRRDALKTTYLEHFGFFDYKFPFLVLLRFLEGDFVFPTKRRPAARAVYVADGMKASDENSVLSWTQSHVHPAIGFNEGIISKRGSIFAHRPLYFEHTASTAPTTKQDTYTLLNRYARPCRPWNACDI